MKYLFVVVLLIVIALFVFEKELTCLISGHNLADYRVTLRSEAKADWWIATCKRCRTGVYLMPDIYCLQKDKVEYGSFSLKDPESEPRWLMGVVSENVVSVYVLPVSSDCPSGNASHN